MPVNVTVEDLAIDACVRYRAFPKLVCGRELVVARDSEPERRPAI